MFRKFFRYAPLLLVVGALAAEEAPAPETVAKADVQSDAPAPVERAKPGGADAVAGAKTLSGMSILGNQEAPKALVIVPWKSSQLGDALGLSKHLDDGRRPVDKDVFMRELAYYEIRSQ